MKKTYWEKLKDPRWQRKRLEALNSAEFRCQLCYDDESTLHVHHKQYFKGREPWDYDVAQLAVLCEACHAEHHSSEDRLALACSWLPMDGPNSRDSVASLIAAFSFLDIGEEFDNFTVVARELARLIFIDVDPNIHDLLDIGHAAHKDAKALFETLHRAARQILGAG